MRQVPIHSMLGSSVGDLAKPSLYGCRCAECSEVAVGAPRACPNCGSDNLGPLGLSGTGMVWSYTVVRHKPPGNYLGAEPFAPFAVGLVELPEGVQIMTRLEVPLKLLRVGLPVQMQLVALRPVDDKVPVGFVFVIKDEQQ